MRRFVAGVRGRGLSPSDLTPSQFENHLPRFLDDIVAELRAGPDVRPSSDARDVSDTAPSTASSVGSSATISRA